MIIIIILFIMIILIMTILVTIMKGAELVAGRGDGGLELWDLAAGKRLIIKIVLIMIIHRIHIIMIMIQITIIGISTIMGFITISRGVGDMKDVIYPFFRESTRVVFGDIQEGGGAVFSRLLSPPLNYPP